MKAMILAAGKGTRVQPLTNTTPKPMLPILDVPVMELIIKKLKADGFNEIVINTSYLSEEIENYFKDGSQFGVSIRYSFEGEIIDGVRHGNAIGSAAGMRKIQNEKAFFDDTFLVICGDAIIDADLSKAVKMHKQHGGISSMLLKEVPMESVDKYGVVELDDSDRVVSFQEKPKIEEARSNLVNTGIYIFEPEIFSHIPAEGNYDIGGELFPKLVSSDTPIYGINLPFQWIDIGTIEDYYRANLMALKNEINQIEFSKAGLIVNYDAVSSEEMPHTPLIQDIPQVNESHYSRRMKYAG
ncbi:nucleotidyltransferase family protein [Sulfurovum sp. ST-21]|uniref:Nucleotidyltransferase family protein n=1 Tax=Sulfurovum indicum TaxID=2779528 RepID=A0A7M1S3E1_9BACT|nr:nucleotidyltransferase family protein [Sulfurovum indicum]QOR61947.1 nucleotidyltransferase family protein [Sulfurovum indicum]